MLPKLSTLVMYLSKIVHLFVIWYHQPTFEHQERTIIVEIYMILFGKLLVNHQGKIALVSNEDVGQPRRTRRRGHQGRKKSRNVREGIRDKMVLTFGMNDTDTRKKADQESSPAKLPSTQVGL